MTPMRCTLPPSGQAATAAAAYRAAFPVLTTQRLTLRVPMMQDLPAWTRICNEAFDNTDEEAWEGFCVYVAGWTLHGHGTFAVCLGDTVIGFVSLGLEWDDREPELGYFFDKAFHGQGYATEACTAVREFGFDLLGRGQFVSYIENTNERSNAMAMRLGAQRDAQAETEFGPNQHVWRHGWRHGVTQ